MISILKKLDYFSALFSVIAEIIDKKCVSACCSVLFIS